MKEEKDSEQKLYGALSAERRQFYQNLTMLFSVKLKTDLCTKENRSLLESCLQFCIQTKDIRDYKNFMGFMLFTLRRSKIFFILDFITVHKGLAGEFAQFKQGDTSSKMVEEFYQYIRVLKSTIEKNLITEEKSVKDEISKLDLEGKIKDLHDWICFLDEGQIEYYADVRYFMNRWIKPIKSVIENSNCFLKEDLITRAYILWSIKKLSKWLPADQVVSYELRKQYTQETLLQDIKLLEGMLKNIFTAINSRSRRLFRRTPFSAEKDSTLTMLIHAGCWRHLIHFLERRTVGYALEKIDSEETAAFGIQVSPIRSIDCVPYVVNKGKTYAEHHTAAFYGEPAFLIAAVNTQYLDKAPNSPGEAGLSWANIKHLTCLKLIRVCDSETLEFTWRDDLKRFEVTGNKRDFFSVLSLSSKSKVSGECGFFSVGNNYETIIKIAEQSFEEINKLKESEEAICSFKAG